MCSNQVPIKFSMFSYQISLHEPKLFLKFPMCSSQWVRNSITLYLITLAQSWTLITNIDGSKVATYAILFWECKLPFWVVFKVWDLIDWLIDFFLGDWPIKVTHWKKKNKKEKNFEMHPKLIIRINTADWFVISLQRIKHRQAMYMLACTCTSEFWSQRSFERVENTRELEKVQRLAEAK